MINTLKLLVLPLFFNSFSIYLNESKIKGSTDQGTKDVPRRVDFVFSYENGFETSSDKFIKLKTLSMKQFVLRPKHDDKFDVTDHKGLSCVFGIDEDQLIGETVEKSSITIEKNN